MRRSLAVLLSVGLLLFASLGLASGAAAATIAPTTTCSNGVDTTPGLGLICEVTIVNTITASGGTATVTVRECHGAAGDPTATCTTETMVLTEPVTAVTQCNGSTSRGGTLRCSVQVTNNFVGINPSPTAVSVNQCVGSGDGITTGCNPFPANTTGAVITQCNGSANGGTLVELTCTATGTESAGLNVTINQCNGSGNGGGGLVICSANIENNAVTAPTPAPTTAPPAPTTAPPAPTSGGGGPTIPPTDALAPTETPRSDATPAVAAGIFLLAMIVLVSRRSLVRLLAR